MNLFTIRDRTGSSRTRHQKKSGPGPGAVASSERPDSLEHSSTVSFCNEILNIALQTLLCASAINASPRASKSSLSELVKSHISCRSIMLPAVISGLIDVQLPRDVIMAAEVFESRSGLAVRSLRNALTVGDVALPCTSLEYFDLSNAWASACAAGVGFVVALWDSSRNHRLSFSMPLEQLRSSLDTARIGGTPYFDAGGVGVPEWARGRRHRRVAINTDALLNVRGYVTAVFVRDISRGGCGLTHAVQMHAGQQATLVFPQGRNLSGTVAWTDSGRAGLQFMEELAADDPLIGVGW